MRLQTFHRVDITFLLIVTESPPITIEVSKLTEQSKLVPYQSLRCRTCLQDLWAVSEEVSPRTEAWNKLRTKKKARRIEAVEIIAL